MKHTWILLLALTACQTKEMDSSIKSKDYHTAASRSDARVTHLDLNIEVDMAKHIISGTATYLLDENASSDTIYFDTKDLKITKITDTDSHQNLNFELFNPDKILGSALEVFVNKDTKSIAIDYETSENAAALQWIDSSFLYTQSQAILARSWIPCQDGPGIRITYNAKVRVPIKYIALMSAVNPQVKNDSGVYYFKQTRPIPSYLMALAVGDLQFKALSKNTGVYAAPNQVEKCANEFTDLPKMLSAAENLYGKYQWNRYDVLVLPASFPFGGMENPELTFATPTIIAGDKSLVSLLAHELAHSWSGNLVTNATWNDFWLNEGFTVYFERRIMEAIEGKEYNDMLQVLGYQDLKEELNAIGKDNADTKLYLDLKGRDPDDGLTDVAYEKGALFLIHIERIVGREKFDTFLKNYFQSNAFKTMDTKGFIAYLNDNLIKDDVELGKKINADSWIFQPNLPQDIPTISAKRLDAVDSALLHFLNGEKLANIKFEKWSSHEYLYFIRGLSSELSQAQIDEIKAKFNFAESGNSELAAAWFEYAIHHQYKSDYPALERFLISVGRRKFLMPLYSALIETEEGKKIAKDIYGKARSNYHFVSVQSLDELLSY
jgi:aminopeptidase N